MKLRILLFPFALASATPVYAHPGVGIAMDSRGTIFYTDLAQVWQITPDGRRTIAVPNVHTHELAIDARDNLIGEEVRSVGGTWQHRIWQRSPDGRLTDLIPWQDGFWQDHGLSRDRSGTMYWVQCPDRICVLRKRSPDGRATELARGSQFNYLVNWLAVSPTGAVYFGDGPDVRKLDEHGILRTVAAGLAPAGNQNARDGSAPSG